VKIKINLLFLLMFSFPLIWGCAANNGITPLDSQDQFALAKQKYEKKKHAEAVAEFQKVVFNFPGASFADSAQYLLAMSYFNDKDYVMASSEFKKVIASFPTSPLSDDASFMLAFSDYKLSPKSALDQKYTYQALDELKSFLEYYPESERIAEAKKLLSEINNKLAKKNYESGYFYFKLKLYESALIYLNEVVDKYQDTQWYPKTKFQIAETYFRQNKKDEAKKEFEEFLQSYPDHPWSEKAKKELTKLETKFNQAQADTNKNAK
jgi:outer membrane protein assembly factor BamD